MVRPGALGDLCQHQARTPRPELAAPLHLGVVQPARGLQSQRENTAEGGACLAVNDVGKPGAGEPHARFDRGPLAKQQPRRAGTDAPTGKPAGLSPATYRSLTSQRPTSPAWRFSSAGWWGGVAAVPVGSVGIPAGWCRG